MLKEQRPKRGLSFNAVWSDFGGTFRGIVVSGCNNTSEELEYFCDDHNDFLEWVGGHPDEAGKWRFVGHIEIFRDSEGQCEADVFGEWTKDGKTEQC